MISGSESSPGEGIGYPLQYSWACLVAQMLKIHLQCGRHGFHPWVGKICWRRAWQPTPVFFPGESPRTEEPRRLQSTGLQSQTRLSNQVPLIGLQICLPNQAVNSSSTEQYLSLAVPSVQHGNWHRTGFRMMLVPKQ